MQLLKKVTCCAFILLLFAAQFVPASADEHVVPEKKIQGSTIVRLHETRGISPDVLRVKSGHTVVWLNEINSLIEIKFIGRQITMACDSPVNFVIDIDGSFVSNKIPIGAVASLCLVQKGKYEYSVQKVSRGAEKKPEQKIYHGQIIVE